MFTGIVEELGAVESIESRAAGARLKIHCRKVLEDMTEGASIAVNGVCLTAVESAPGIVLGGPGAGDSASAATWARCARFRASIWSGL
jgi:riboflavin synthase